MYGVPYIPLLMYISSDCLIGFDYSSALDPLFPPLFLYMRVLRADLLCELIIRGHLIPLFPEMVFIPEPGVKSRVDLDCDLMIRRHLILLFPEIRGENFYFLKNMQMTSSSVHIHSD